MSKTKKYACTQWSLLSCFEKCPGLNFNKNFFIKQPDLSQETVCQIFMNFTQIKNLSQAVLIFQKAAESSLYTYMQRVIRREPKIEYYVLTKVKSPRFF